MRIIRIGAFAFAFWMIGFGIFIFVGSLRYPDPMQETLMPLAALVGVVLGILLLLALWAFPFSRRGRAYGDDDD